MGSKRPSADSNNTNEVKKQKNSGYWALGLLDAMKDPKCIFKEDELVVVIKDKYPKAEFHYLILPREDISSLKKVGRVHAPLLKHMQSVAEVITADDIHKHKKFKIGYHTEASMARLHLHVLSDDMISECLKTKKHWNTYNTSFFLDSKDICDQLDKEGVVKLLKPDICKKLLETPLKCHKCNYIPKNMPKLKEHLLSHN